MSSKHTTGESERGDEDAHRDVHQLTGFQRDLLYVIAGLERPSGQDIKERLEARSGRDITHGRLYPNLDVLVTNEFVEKGEIDRRTNYYAATDYGLDALQSYHEWGDEQLQNV